MLYEVAAARLACPHFMPGSSPSGTLTPRAGVLASLAAYALWGLFPLYFRALRALAPLEVLAHRIVGSALLLLALLALRRRWAWLRVARRREVLWSFVGSSLLLSLNWFVYIHAVVIERVVDASLGYFINPLVSVLLGVMLLGERPRRAQWVAIGLAFSGVAWLAISTRQVPWIGVLLAASFGSYGFLRKVAKLGSLEGLALETLLLSPPAALALIWFIADGQGGLAREPELLPLVLAAGPLTAVPLLLFAAGARAIPLSTAGFLQYVSPSIQFALGVFVFREPFSMSKLGGFSIIWAALVVYSLET